MGNKTVRIHRMGSITFGLVLIILGGIYLLHIILPAFISLQLFRFWPAVLILLGVEVLIGNRRKTCEVTAPDGRMVEEERVVYDIPAIIMTACTLMITLSLAWADWAYTTQAYGWYFR